MRVSELQPAAYPQSPSVELPNSDAHRLFTNDFNKNSFIEANGDVEVVWNEQYKYWAVPAFAESRKVYSDAKAIDCARWGCEQGLTYKPSYGKIEAYERQFPNSMLPEEYHNNRDGVRTLADLESMHNDATQPSQHQLDKAAKAERCEKYRQQWEANESIEYDVDEDRLYKNELTFCKLAADAGWIEIDDEQKKGQDCY